MGENNPGNHPFGENPFGEGVIVDSSFGNPMSGNGGNDSEDEGSNEKVCPHCGTAMVGEETYCMVCGMSVMPVLKRDYEKAMQNDSIGNNTYGTAYGSTSAQNGNSYMDRTGGGYYGGNGSDRGRSARGERSRGSGNANNGYYAMVAIVGIIALIFAVFFVIKGIGAAREEKVTVVTRHVVSPIADREETYTLYATGDKLTRMTFLTDIDVNGRDQRSIDQTVLKTRQNYAAQEELTFVNLDINQTDGRLIITLDYQYLNVKENVDRLYDMGVLVFTGEGDRGNKDYVSYKTTLDLLKQQQFRER